MNTQDMIDITGVDLVELTKAAYRLSAPQGLGFLHAKDGELSDEEAQRLIQDDPYMPLRMDYVHGRACKLGVYKIKERLYIYDMWYDHTDDDLEELLEAVGVER